MPKRITIIELCKPFIDKMVEYEHDYSHDDRDHIHLISSVTKAVINGRFRHLLKHKFNAKLTPYFVAKKNEALYIKLTFKSYEDMIAYKLAVG